MFFIVVSLLHGLRVVITITQLISHTTHDIYNIFIVIYIAQSTFTKKYITYTDIDAQTVRHRRSYAYIHTTHVYTHTQVSAQTWTYLLEISQNLLVNSIVEKQFPHTLHNIINHSLIGQLLQAQENKVDTLQHNGTHYNTNKIHYNTLKYTIYMYIQLHT